MTWLPTNWRVVKLGVEFDGISFTNTYAIPDDGRDIDDLTLGELMAYPMASAAALLDSVVNDHRSGACS